MQPEQSDFLALVQEYAVIHSSCVGLTAAGAQEAAANHHAREVELFDLIEARLNTDRAESYRRGIAEGLRQATEGWEREWGAQYRNDSWVQATFDSEAEARQFADGAIGHRAVSRLVGPWEPAEQPAPAPPVREDDPLSCGECYDIAHDELDERETCDEHAEQPEGSDR